MQKPTILEGKKKSWEILVESAETQDLKAHLEKETKLSFGKDRDAITGSAALDLLTIERSSIEENELQLVLNKYTQGRKYAF